MTTINSTVRPDLVLDDEDQAHWVSVHPEVLEAAPKWAQRMTLDFQHDGTVMVGYDGYFGPVEIGMSSTWQGGIVTPCDGGFTEAYLKTEGVPATGAYLEALSRHFAEAAAALSAENPGA